MKRMIKNRMVFKGKNMKKFEDIYRDYFEIVYKYLYCLTKNKDLAEDLAQETFFKAIRKINTLKNESKVLTWLCQIAKNLWYDELKRSKKIEYMEIDVDFYEDIENIVILNDEKRELREEINKLDLTTRDVMYLRIYGELSFSEIGAIKGRNETWARVTFYRGKNKLMEMDFND